MDLAPADKTARALQLMEKTMAWARAVGPEQPLIAGVYSPLRSWQEEGELDPNVAFMLHEPDVISFHSWESAESVAGHLDELGVQDRPIQCTE